MPRLLILLLIFILAQSCSSEPTVRIGSKIDTEGAILGYIQLLALQRAGIAVEDRIETGPTLITRRALLYGELDGYIEYTGTALVNFMSETNPEKLTNPKAGWKQIRSWDSDVNSVIWLESWSGINNTYTVLIRRELAESSGLKVISDLQAYLKSGNKLVFGVDPEFAARPDGLAGLLNTYQLESNNLSTRQMDAGLVYQSLGQAGIDIAIGYATDGRIAANDLLRLSDDLQYFPVYNPAPTFRKDVLVAFPKIRETLKNVAAAINADDITRMNYLHDVEYRRAKELAEEWLKENQLW